MNLSMASPILADGKLIVAGGTLEQLIAGTIFYQGSTGRGFVIALEPKKGELLWKYDLGPKPEPLNPPITITDACGRAHVLLRPGDKLDLEHAVVRRGDRDDLLRHRRQHRAAAADGRQPESAHARVVRGRGSERPRRLREMGHADQPRRRLDQRDAVVRPKEGRYKDQSIGDTPKIYTIAVEGKPTKVVGVGCKNGGFYVIDAADGRIVAHTPIYTGPPTYPLSPDAGPADARACRAPSAACRPAARPTARRSSPTASTPCGWRRLSFRCRKADPCPAVASWRLARTRGRSAGGTNGRRSLRSAGPPPKPVYTDAGDPVASGIAVANGVVYFTAVASGKLVALDAASGSVLKEIDLGPVWSGPSVSRGRVYVGTGNTQFTPADYETFLPKKYTGVLYSFGLPGEDEVSRLGAGGE